MNYQDILSKYKINPESVRNFSDFTIFKNQYDTLQCRTRIATDFLYELLDIDKKVFEIKDKLIANDTGIIIDGNLRYFFLSQIIHYDDYKILDIDVEIRNDDPYLYQLKNPKVNLSLREKIQALDNYRKNNEGDIEETIETELGNKYRRYLKYLDDYQALPEWLKLEGDAFNVSLITLLNFNRQKYNSMNDWKSIKKIALKDSINHFVISSKHVKSYQEAKVALEEIWKKNQDIEDIDNEIINTLSQLKEFFINFNPDEWYGTYKEICQDHQRFLEFSEKFLYILKS